MLIITHRSVMQFHDAYKQGAFRLIELRNQMDNLFSGKGFSFWSWYEGPGLDEPLENFVDPCSIIGALFPIRYLELGFTVAALLRMYLGGIAFLFMGRETGLKKDQSLLGAVVYAFSACFIGLALRQSEQLVNAYLFPLLIASVDRIYKGKKPTVFILTVAYYLIVSIYFAYMSALTLLIYILLRYFAYNDSFDLRHYVSTITKFICCGLIGIMLSAFTSVFSAFTIMRASTDSSGASYGVLFDARHYLTLGKMLLGTGATYDYSDIGPHIIVLLLMPIAIKRCTRMSTNTIMTVILFAMILFPVFCGMFNGFGYVSFRWTYCLLLFAVWSAAEQFDIDTIKERGSLLLASLGLLTITAWTFVLYTAGSIEISRTGRLFVPVQILSGALIILLFAMMRKKESISRRMYVAIFAVPLISLSIGWSYGFYNNIENFAKNATVYKNLQKSALRVGAGIDDSDFYRIDSVDAISRHVDIKFPSNENIWWKTNNLIIYNSRIPERMTNFNVDMGNSYGYARRVFNLSNGNRRVLDFLYGVRYFLGSDTGNEKSRDSDNYAGLGFERYCEIDGVTVFKNKYDAGLGFVPDKAISESEFDRLDRIQKEQALMQAAVIPDNQLEKCEGVRFAKAEELDLEVAEFPYEISETDGVIFEGNSFKANKKDASFVIDVKGIRDCELMLSFDNLLLNSKDGKKGSSYELYADNGRVRKHVINQNSRQGVQNLKNHSLSMGYYTSAEDVKIKLTVSAKGRYSFDKIYVSAASTANFDRYAARCSANRLRVSEYDDKRVIGKVDADNNGVLLLSIPAYDNWDIYVDGKKSDRINNADGCFAGVNVSKGEHEIVLKYNNLYVKYGSLVFVLGVILLMIWIKLTQDREQRMTL